MKPVANPDWLYDADLVRVVDGDTVVMVLTRTFDFGFGILSRLEFPAELRLADINTPEKRSTDPDERTRAIAAQDALTGWFGRGIARIGAHAHPFIVATRKHDKWGRYTARIWPVAGGTESQSANEYLVEQGFAVPFMVGQGGV